MKRSIFLLSLVLLLMLVVTGSASAATWTEIQEVDVGISYPSWVQIQRVDVVVYPAQWTLIQTVDVEISQAEWVLIQTVEVSVTIPAGVLLWTGLGDDNLASNPANWNQGIAPFNGADIVFNGTSVKSCTWDLDASAVTVHSLTLATGYTGELTQGDVDMGIGAGGYLQQAGTFVGKPTRNVVCAGQFVKIGGSLKSLNITFTGVASSFTTNTGEDVIYKIRNENSLTIKSGCYVNNIENLGSMVLPTGTFLRYAPTSVGCTFSNAGTITGDGTLNIWLYNHDPGIAFGDISSRVSIRTSYVPTTNPIVTMQGDGTTGPLTIFSQHATYAITFDLNGHSLTAASVTVGTRGNILWGEGTHRIGGLDTSAGSSDFESSQVIMTGGGSIKLANGQKVNDLTLASGTRTMLLSDLDVKGTITGVKNLVLNNYRLILSGSSKVGSYPSNFNVSEPVFIPIISPIQDGLQIYGDIPRWLRYDAVKGGLYGIPTQLGMNDFNITVYSPYVSLLTQRISFAVVDVPTIEHASKGQSIGNIISIVLTMFIVGICGITRSPSGGFDYDVSNALLGAAVGISVLVFASVIPSYGLVLVALIFVAMYWGGR